MRILVHVNTLDIGGSQSNAVDLAVEMRSRGHDVVLFGPPGPLCERAIAGGVIFEAAPDRPRWRPSPSIIKALLSAVDRHRIEVVHGYEWPPILEDTYGPGALRGCAVVGTVMSMGVASFIPRQIPLIVGTVTIRDREASRRERVHLIEPPVDLVHDDPSSTYPDIRAELGPTPRTADEVLVVVVGRLAAELKLEGLLAAIGAVGRLAEELPIRLVIVGDGPAKDVVTNAAARINQDVGRPVVDLVGSRLDPRPWYAAADISLGMGGSALRAMAFGTPLVVQGERGFWKLLSPDTLPVFLRQGWYGVGNEGSGTDALEPLLRALATDERLRRDLGRYARSVVEMRFSLDHAGEVQEQIYAEAMSSRERGLNARHLVGPLAHVLGYEARRRILHHLGRADSDDFNALSRQPNISAETSHD